MIAQLPGQRLQIQIFPTPLGLNLHDALLEQFLYRYLIY